MIDINFGEYLLINRRRKGLSIQALAEKSGINRNTISQIEGGDFMGTRLDTLKSLCDVLEIDLMFKLKEVKKDDAGRATKD